jgi:hypothetical protein
MRSVNTSSPLCGGVDRNSGNVRDAKRLLESPLCGGVDRNNINIFDGSLGAPLRGRGSKRWRFRYSHRGVAPLRGRGSKLVVLQVLLGLRVVAPLRGRGSKRFRRGLYTRREPSPLCGGVDRNMEGQLIAKLAGLPDRAGWQQVAPLRGRGSKLLSKAGDLGIASRVRGRPFAGAWIETAHLAGTEMVASRPFAGARCETSRGTGTTRRPFAGAWIETLAWDRHHTEKRSPLCGGVDRKFTRVSGVLASDP